MIIDIKKFKKYDKPGPRYTSYPTAPQFSENFSADNYLDEIIRTNKNETKTDISLYFHLPYCDTLCYFCGCNMIITRNRDRVKEYVNYVKKEIDLIRTYIDPNRKVTQLHWGGGTPTHLNPDEISNLTSYIFDSFNFDRESENSCEIDPRGLTREHLESLRTNGFNRISMGVQDFNEKVQEATNRIQPEELTQQTIEWIKDLEYQSINLDLIYGLPYQNAKSFENTVDKVIKIAPDRIAVFNYAHLPWLKKHMALISEETLPPPEEKLEILKMTIEKLTDAGYLFLGMDHFAKPNDELAVAFRDKKLYRNFQGYSTRAGADLYAFGITGISQLGNVYSQNYKTEKEYYNALDNEKFPIAKGYKLSNDDIIRKYVIMRLMCDFELSIKHISERFDINFFDYFRNLINGDHGVRDDGRE